MGAADRTVQHLHLRAPNAQAAAHAVHRLEDALRCASLPDAGERVLLVRRLHLGRLPESLSSQSLSLLIEQCVAAVGGEWVHGVEERAAHSDTVFFASRLQAAQAALRWRAQGAVLGAWYWPLALPGMAVQAAPAVFVAQLLDVVSQWREAAAALPALVGSVQAPATQRWWREHLPLAWRERLAHAALPGQRPVGTTRRAVAPSDTTEVRADAGPGRGVVPLAAVRAAEEATRTDGSAVHNEHPPHRSERSASARRAAHVKGPPAASEKPTGPTLPPAGNGPSWRAGDAGPRTVPVAATPEAAGGEVVEPERIFETPGAIAAGLAFEAHATGAGGVLFLWPVLERLGFAAWDADHPDTWLGPRVLSRALQRLRVPDTDPVWAMLASLPAPSEATEVLDQPAAQWLQACRRHARRELRIGLASLVLRPGWVHWSATHIDVHFSQRDADIRVRRAALDINPGWVDGLQRVVSFHYDREDPPT